MLKSKKKQLISTNSQSKFGNISNVKNSIKLHIVNKSYSTKNSTSKNTKSFEFDFIYIGHCIFLFVWVFVRVMSVEIEFNSKNMCSFCLIRVGCMHQIQNPLKWCTCFAKWKIWIVFWYCWWRLLRYFIWMRTWYDTSR